MTSNTALQRGYRNNGFSPDEELDPFYQYRRPGGGAGTRNALPSYGSRDRPAFRGDLLPIPDRKVGRSICMTMAFFAALAVILLVGLGIFVALYFSGLQAADYSSTATPRTVGSTSVGSGTGRTPLSGQVSIDMILTIDRDFRSEYNDPTSAEYQELENTVATWVDSLLRNSGVMAVYSQNQIIGFSEGSVLAALRLRFREALIDVPEVPSDLNAILRLFVDDVEEIIRNAIDQPGCCAGLDIIRNIVNSATIDPPPDEPIDGGSPITVNPQPTDPQTSAPMVPQTAPQTDPPTAAASEAPTAAPTDPPVDPPTEPPVDPPTDPPVDPPTDPPVDPPTDPPVDPPTDPPVDPPTDPPVDPPTDPPVDPPTDPPVDPPTAPPVDPPTAPPVDPPTDPPVDPPTDPPVDPPTNPPSDPPTVKSTDSPTDPPASSTKLPSASTTGPPIDRSSTPFDQLIPTITTPQAEPTTNEAPNATFSSTSPSIESTPVPPEDPCASNDTCKNGGICNSTLDGFVCECLSDFVGLQCEYRSNPYNLVLVADGPRIYVAPADTFDFTAIPGLDRELGRAVAVDYDPADGMVYWTDNLKMSISRSRLDGTSANDLITNLQIPDGLCLDTEHRVMFWTDRGSDLIERATFEGMERSVVLNLADETADFVQPRAIIVDTVHSNLYWTDWGTLPKIQRVSTNGTSRIVLVDTGLYWPNGLTIDQQGGRVYWCDAYYDAFESVDLSGQDRRLHVQFSDQNVHPFDVFFYQNYLFWTSWLPSNDLLRLELDSPSAILKTVGNVDFTQIAGLHFYDDNFANHSCVDSKPCGVAERCRQFSTSYQCVCRDGLEGDGCQLLSRVMENITVGTNETVQITSPGYPDNYPRNVAVTWVIRTDENWKIRLLFPNQDPSIKDVWRVGNGENVSDSSSLVATWVRGGDISDLLSEENTMWVSHRKFYPMAEREAFVIAATSVPSSETPNCGVDEFECGNSVCLDGDVECNFFPECADESDELECDGCNTTSYITAAYNSSFSIFSTASLRTHDDSSCFWSVIGPSDSHIAVHILQYQLEANARIIFGYYDGGLPKSLADFGEGPLDPRHLLFKRDSIRIWYYVNASSSFHLAIEALRPSDYVECEVYPYIYLHDEACDRVLQCPNGDDEMNCECQPDEHQCQNSICVSPAEADCNGMAECRDYSDEGTACYEGYCTAIEDNPCAAVLPYNMTFFPNDFVLSLRNAEDLIAERLDQFMTNCSADDRLALCMSMFPECPRFGPERRVCASLCSDAVQCLGLGANFMGLQCDVYPDNGVLSTSDGCLYDDADILGIGDCGRRPAASPDLNPYSRIINGAESHIANWPWIASMRWPGGYHGCAATLITTQWALTAAHCVPLLPSLVFGSSTLVLPPNYPHVRGIAKTVPHPRYTLASIMDDIALVKLAAPVEFSDTIRPACLEYEGDEEEKYDKCHVVGWGLTEHGNPYSISPVLKEGRVPLVTPEVCKNLIKNRLFVSTHQICAGLARDRNGTCHGDSGGPLICQAADGRWKLVGITSAGVICGGEDTTEVYTRVSKYIDFIRHTIASDSDDCSPDEFQCGNSVCIGEDKQCNEFRDCPDGLDEAECDGCNTTSSIQASFNSTFSIYSAPPLRFNLQQCVWYVRAPDNAHIAIHIIDYHLSAASSVSFGYGWEPLSETVEGILRDGPHDRGHLGFRYDRLWIFYFPASPSDFHLGIQAVTSDDYLNCEAHPYIYLNNERCDRVSQCPNGDDEKDCECIAEEHECGNGICVSPADAQCNGVVECADFSDEGLDCYDNYCVEIANAVCSAVLPYNMTFFPNDFVVSHQQANDSITEYLPQLTTNCTESERLALCMSFFPECPQFGAQRRVCASFCLEALECIGLEDGATALQCGVYPDRGVLSTPEGCNYDDRDILQTGECGTRPAASPFLNPYSRIIDGVETHIANWPWIASFRYLNGFHGCGAVLIKPQWAITAAHCDGQSYLVFGISTHERPPMYPHVRQVVKRISHPGWKGSNYHDDIALLKLDTPVQFTDTIRPACLEYEGNEEEKYDTCHVVGWGKTDEALDTTSPVLKEARVPLIPLEQCLSYDIKRFLFLSSSQICAGVDGGNSTCRGDSGGPLICRGSNGRWNLVGLTSTVTVCRGFQTPAVYTRISQYIDFIRRTIASDGE
ncbi:uncharacterized protein LOC119724891 [Patiria miniata]|uniref:Uncharacterized protein n=1 Tax=Patiria miniata TaxID=46514 RepID=A0A913ZLB2_PATMI|nr:uncharacterized protein LOC119724891 [Patiria miniata]